MVKYSNETVSCRFIFISIIIFCFTVESDELDPLSLFEFPRLVIVNKNDHKHAALYPPTTRRRKKNEEFTRETILAFIHSYLQEPESWIIETEHF
jgi:hypothetical protein